jgi:hypothetical protein
MTKIALLMMVFSLVLGAQDSTDVMMQAAMEIGEISYRIKELRDNIPHQSVGVSSMVTAILQAKVVGLRLEVRRSEMIDAESKKKLLTKIEKISQELKEIH